MTVTGDSSGSRPPDTATVADEVRAILGSAIRLADAIREQAERQAEQTRQEARRELEAARREAESVPSTTRTPTS